MNTIKGFVLAVVTIGLLAPISAWAACEEFTDTLPNHEAAGRVEKRNQTCWGTFCYGGTYYAIGSNENLGTSTWTQVTLNSSQAGVWSQGTCPEVTGPACEFTLVEERVTSGNEYYMYAEGYVDDPEGISTAFEYRYPGTDNFDEWRRAGWNNTAKDFITYQGPVLAQGTYSVEGRAVLSDGSYGETCTRTFTLGNHTPFCRASGLITNDQPVDGIYGRWSVVMEIIDQDGDVDRTDKTPEVLLDLPNQTWRKTTPDAFQNLLTFFTDEPGELNLGQDYVLKSRLWEKDGTEITCTDRIFTAEDKMAPYVVAPERIEVQLGSTFDPLDPAYGIYAVDDYDSSDLLTITVYDEVDTSTTGTTEVAYGATDSKGNGPVPNVRVEVVVFDPNQNSAPIINSAYDEVDGNNVTITGIASDVDGDIVSVTITVSAGKGGTYPASCTGTEQFTCTANNLDADSYEFELVATDSADNKGMLTYGPVTIVPQTECYETTLAQHEAAGRAYLQYYSYYATGSATYLGSSFLNNDTVVALEKTGNNWNKVTSCP